jgi:hypothetical protein
MIQLDLQKVALRLKQDEGKTLVFDPVRKKWLVLTPEEHVRQYIIGYLVNKLQYPAALLSVEKKIMVGAMAKRFDIVVYNREHQPWMLIECKAPEVSITELALNQLLQYHSKLNCSYWVLTNGHQTFCADARDVQHITWLTELPLYNI